MRYGLNLWEPSKVFRNFAEVFPRVFDPEAKSPDVESTETYRIPKVDIFDDGANFIVSAELPGINKENLDLDVKENRLTIKGTKNLENETERQGYLKIERSYGMFERTFFLDDGVDKENIKAEYKDGVLRVTLPKKEEEASKKIQVS